MFPLHRMVKRGFIIYWMFQCVPDNVFSVCYSYSLNTLGLRDALGVSMRVCQKALTPTIRGQIVFYRTSKHFRELLLFWKDKRVIFHVHPSHIFVKWTKTNSYFLWNSFFCISFKRKKLVISYEKSFVQSDFSHSAVIFVLQSFMGHFVVVLMEISAVLSEEVAKDGDLWDSEIRLNSFRLLSLDKALSTACKTLCIVCVCVCDRGSFH